MRRLVMLVLLLGSGVAGCSHPEPSPAVPATATPAPTPTPTVLASPSLVRPPIPQPTLSDVQRSQVAEAARVLTALEGPVPMNDLDFETSDTNLLVFGPTLTVNVSTGYTPDLWTFGWDADNTLASVEHTGVADRPEGIALERQSGIERATRLVEALKTGLGVPQDFTETSSEGLWAEWGTEIDGIRSDLPEAQLVMGFDGAFVRFKRNWLTHAPKPVTIIDPVAARSLAGFCTGGVSCTAELLWHKAGGATVKTPIRLCWVVDAEGLSTIWLDAETGLRLEGGIGWDPIQY